MDRFFVVKIGPGSLKRWKSSKELRQSRLGFQAANSRPELEPELQRQRQFGLLTQNLGLEGKKIVEVFGFWLVMW